MVELTKVELIFRDEVLATFNNGIEPTPCMNEHILYDGGEYIVTKVTNDLDRECVVLNVV